MERVQQLKDYGLTLGEIREIFDLARDPEERDNLAERRSDLSRSLLSLIEDYRRRMKKILDEKGKPSLDRQLRERLKALGYIK